MKMKNDTPTVILPVETITRELDSKLAIASALASMGLQSIVGHKDALTVVGNRSKRITWQGKGLFADDPKHGLWRPLSKNKSAAMFMHDEGGIFPENVWVDNMLQKHRIHQLRDISVNTVCLWGALQKQVIAKQAPELASTLAVTGCPRFDLCGTNYSWIESAANETIHSTHQPYILMCSRFTSIAHDESIQNPFTRKVNPNIWPKAMSLQDVSELWYTSWQRDVHDFADFVVAVKEIAKTNPDYTIVLRPHPSESLDFYKEALKPFKNIQVIRSGSVLGWIRSAEVVVHTNCTTGVEAILAGRPTINFLPDTVPRENLDKAVSREAGMVTRSIEETVERVSEIVNGGDFPQVWSDRAKSILLNLETDSIPVLAKETRRCIDSAGITASKVTLPSRESVKPTGKVDNKKTLSPYTASKRIPLEREYIESFIDGCISNNLGSGKVGYSTERLVVIEP